MVKKDPLAHPRRLTVYAYIRDHPGATFREVARQSGIATGTARHHLNVLKRHRVIVQHPHRGTLRFFASQGGHETTWRATVLLREPGLALLHGWLAERQATPQKEILVEMAGAQGWSRSTTQHRLQRLEAAGLLRTRMQGRWKLYSGIPVREAFHDKEPMPQG
ncbi:MAG TPA: helix-turn-helix domain-containing protein [Candidatus Thermoplasmatota archaeon]|nr:helix-turn-helix domain-containing protein [Candidatus Thermoplasmatota archaeon]